MKRFVVFGGACYYASGGLHDYVGSFDTLEEAEGFAKRTHRLHPATEQHEPEFEWWHIFDMEKRRVVKWSQYQGYGAPDDKPSLEQQTLSKAQK